MLQEIILQIRTMVEEVTGRSVYSYGTVQMVNLSTGLSSFQNWHPSDHRIPWLQGPNEDGFDNSCQIAFRIVAIISPYFNHTLYV